MFQLSFIISQSKLATLNEFLDSFEDLNFSIFENSEMGFLDILDDNEFPIAKFFNIEIYDKEQPILNNIKSHIEELFKNENIKISINKIDNKDWIKLYTNELHPIKCGNFLFYNDLMDCKLDYESSIPIKLNSALAFGSGHHQTTQSCLQNMEYLNQKRFYPKKILDMGCGTGVLGICALKIWEKADLLGIDIDSEAVEITKANYEENHIKATAYVDKNLNSLNEKSDLIFCNILKQPLIDLCPQFFEKLTNTGYIITSGYINSQEKEVTDYYESQGFSLEHRISSDEWISIIFQKNV